jgi:hypothetical protein
MKTVLLIFAIGFLSALAFFVGFVAFINWLLPKDKKDEEI